MPSFSPEIVEVPYYARYWSFSSDCSITSLGFQPSKWGLVGEGRGKHWTNTDFTKWKNDETYETCTKSMRKSWDGCPCLTNSSFKLGGQILEGLSIHACIYIYMYINCKAHHRAPPAPANGRDATLQEITSVSTSIWCATCNLPGTSIYEVSPDAPMYIFIDSFCPFMASMCTYLIHNPWQCVAWNHEFNG